MKFWQSFLLLLFLLCGFGKLTGQNVVWADKVIGFSSQYSDKTYSANQATGKPNVLPQFRDSPCAWSPLRESSKDAEYIHVGFSTPIQAVQVAVAQSFNPGAVTKIYVYDTDGKEYLVFKDDNPKPNYLDGFTRSTFSAKSRKINAVKVVMNTFLASGWNHIDAIGLSTSTQDIQAKINIVEEMKFDSEPQNLGTGVNSRYDEIMPVISPDGKTLYFDRKDHPENTEGKINDDIWMSTVTPDGFWTQAKNLGSPLNNDGHNFLSAITPDGNTILLGNVYEPDGSMSSGLSSSYLTATGWSFPKKISIIKYYNLNKYSEFHMGADGRTIVMAIEKNDTYGGKDLYVSFKQFDGLWTEPMNLGKTVNSAGTEMSPFLAADGKTLYFSSNGFSGYGGNDMFMIRRLDNSWTRWSEPQNLGDVLNSPNWDAYYSIPASGEFAYFSSENHSIGRTDIFRIKLPQEIKPDPVVLVVGKVLDELTKEPIEANIIYELLPSGEEIGVATSSPLTGEYKIVLPAGAKYGVRADVKSYLSVNEKLDFTNITEYKELNKDLFLVPLVMGGTVVLQNITFKPSSSDLLPESTPELRRIVKFMNDNPAIKIEVGGHTNNSCSEEYCVKLSTARAKSVAEFLAQNGVMRDRISYKGYGSRRPIASNDSREGKIKNRRVDFTIKEM